MPFNTTHYAFELEAQLEKYDLLPRLDVIWGVHFADSVLCYGMCRVELLADEFAITVDFAPLRSAIQGLQLASIELDKAKVKAEARLDRLVGRWHRRMARKQWLKKVWRKIKGIFKGHQDDDEEIAGHSCSKHMHADGQCGQGDIHAHSYQSHDGAMRHRAHEHMKAPGRKFRKAAREVQKINHKLASFERGFIVEDGFVGREWYKVRHRAFFYICLPKMFTGFLIHFFFLVS